MGYRIIRSVNKDGEVFRDIAVKTTDMLNENGYLIPARKLGARQFDSVKMPKGVSDGDLGKMTRLSQLMVGESNMLGYRVRGGIKAYTAEELYGHVGLCGKRGREFIKRMKESGMIKCFADVKPDGRVVDEFYINPAYFFHGRRISMNLYLMFREQLDPIIPAWVRNEFLSNAKAKVSPVLHLAIVDKEEVLEQG